MALPAADVTCVGHAPGKEEEEQCAVCRMEFEAGEDVRLLPCSHVYHPDCIGQWLHINKVLLLACSLHCLECICFPYTSFILLLQAAEYN